MAVGSADGDVAPEVSQLVLDARDGNLLGVNAAIASEPPPSEEHLAVALWAACCQGNEAVTRTLIDAGADLDYFDDTGFTALLWACEASSVQCVKMLLEAGADVNFQTSGGATPLIMACDLSNPSQDLQIIEELIKAGANVNAVDEQKASALLFASERGNPEAVRQLLEAGAELETQDDEGETALLRAAQYAGTTQEQDAEEVEGEGDEDARQISTVCGEEAVKVVELLLAKGANINAQDLEGDTAALLAARDGCRLVAGAILRHGPDTSLRNEKNTTVLKCLEDRAAAEVDSVEKEAWNTLLNLVRQREASEPLSTDTSAAHVDPNGSNGSEPSIRLGANLARRKRARR